MRAIAVKGQIAIAVMMFLCCLSILVKVNCQQVITESDSIVPSAFHLPSPPPPPPPPPPLDSGFEAFEVYPLFPGCEKLSRKEASDCTGQKIKDHIYENLIIPPNLDPSDSTCMAVIQFVINVDGGLSDFVIRRDPCEGCGAAALAAVKSLQELPLWTPARQNRKVVKILYTVPVKFDQP